MENEIILEQHGVTLLKRTRADGSIEYERRHCGERCSGYAAPRPGREARDRVPTCVTTRAPASTPYASNFDALPFERAVGTGTNQIGKE
jgi:hypothetical protein